MRKMFNQRFMDKSGIGQFAFILIVVMIFLTSCQSSIDIESTQRPVVTDAMTLAPSHAASTVTITSTPLKPTETLVPVATLSGPVYLTQLQPISAAVGFATFGEGIWTYTEGDVHNGSAIVSREVVYPHGLFAHAPSALSYNLDGRYSSFHTTFFVHGYQPECDYSGKIRENKAYYNGSVFMIYLDSERVYVSRVITATPPTKPVEIVLDVKDVKNLTLIVDPVNDITYCDITVWGDPYLTP